MRIDSEKEPTCNHCGRATRIFETSGNPKKFCDRKCARAWHGTGSDRKNRNLWARHRLRYSAYLQILSNQDHKCAACGVELTELYHGDGNTSRGVSQIDQSPHIDHCHSCSTSHETKSQFSCGNCRRAILCGSCNIALGYALEDPERLRLLADYIEEWNGRPTP